MEREGAILHHAGTVMIADFTFIHEDGRMVHLEIIGFWTPQYLAKKIKKLHAVDATNIVIAVPDQLNCANADFPGTVLHFKQRLLLKDVLPMLEAVARVPL
ncbi:MAG: DUF790 family protein [Armatimonadota bacterium]